MVKSNFSRIFAIVAAFLIAFSIMAPIHAVGIDTLDIGDNYKIIGIDNTGTTTGPAKILAEYRNVIVGVSGVATLTFVVLFIINFIKLGKSSSNPQERSHCINSIIVTGIATAGCGGVLLFVGFFYNLLA